MSKLSDAREKVEGRTKHANNIKHRCYSRCQLFSDWYCECKHTGIKIGFTLLRVMGYYCVMAIARSKLTAQGQISVPAAIRRRLGIGPGSVLEWEDEDEKIVVRRAGQYTFDDIHKALFPEGKPRRKTLEELSKGIEDYMLEHHAARLIPTSLCGCSSSTTTNR